MAKKSKKKNENIIGAWAFLIGVVLAIILGIANVWGQAWLMALIIIGLIVGFLNVASKETDAFLMSGAVLIIASTFGQNVTGAIPILNRILQSLLAIFVPATIIVAIKNVFSIAKR